MQNQAWQMTESGETPTVDFDSGRGIPSWELKIEGKLLEDVRLISAIIAHSLTTSRSLGYFPPNIIPVIVTPSPSP
jgi:hypothetical protein